MKIETLAAHESLLPVVAEWQHEAFGYLAPAVTFAQRIGRLKLSIGSGQLPRTLLAISEHGDLIGIASILASTIIHPHLTPWLSTVFVPSEHRCKGVASALCLRAVEEVAAMGFPSLHLFTPHNESLYERLGWRTFERGVHNGLDIAIMSRETGA